MNRGKREEVGEGRIPHGLAILEKELVEEGEHFGRDGATHQRTAALLLLQIDEDFLFELGIALVHPGRKHAHGFLVDVGELVGAQREIELVVQTRVVLQHQHFALFQRHGRFVERFEVDFHGEKALQKNVETASVRF